MVNKDCYDCAVVFSLYKLTNIAVYSLLFAVSFGVHDAINAAIEDKRKCWLRQARDRDGSRKRHYEAAEARKR